MAFPTTGILDDFNRADETPLSGGGNWGDRNTSQDLSLVSNRVGGAGVNQLSSEYWTVATYGPDCEVYVSATRLASYGTGSYVRLWLRIQNPGAANETGYMMQWLNNASGCSIFKETSREAYTSLATSSTPRFAANDQIGMEAIGTTITVYQNGTSVLSTTDATTTGAGYLAIGCRSTIFRLDDFGGGTVVPASSFVPRAVLI